mmetsp:Transcript_4497/g.8037  ORF Transcript_4497/g.8037 Transcript_4497/m.8037 type:complete len:262 (-) Transcript_4497:244-1029(-)
MEEKAKICPREDENGEKSSATLKNAMRNFATREELDEYGITTTETNYANLRDDVYFALYDFYKVFFFISMRSDLTFTAINGKTYDLAKLLDNKSLTEKQRTFRGKICNLMMKLESKAKSSCSTRCPYLCRHGVWEFNLCDWMCCRIGKRDNMSIEDYAEEFEQELKNLGTEFFHGTIPGYLDVLLYCTLREIKGFGAAEVFLENKRMKQHYAGVKRNRDMLFYVCHRQEKRNKRRRGRSRERRGLGDKATTQQPMTPVSEV